MPHLLDRRSFLRVGGATAAGLVLAPALAGQALAAPAAAVSPRTVALDGSMNTRDVGGYRSVAGRTIAYGRMYRSGTLGTLSDTGLAQLAALNLHTVIDYRTPEEVEASPDRVPQGLPIVSLPVGPAPRPPDAPYPPVPGVPDPAFVATYRSYTSNPASLAAYKQSFALLADAGKLPLLGHDTAGGGRVGWTTALLLTVLGVPRDVVYQEYLYSNVQLGGTFVFTEYLDAAFDQATKQFGNLPAFFAKGLGITPAMLVQLGKNFLGG